MFGSDWPVCLLAGSYQHIVKIIDLFIEDLKQEEKNNIMGGNACNFYNL
jgi:L-fuconolactonase